MLVSVFCPFESSHWIVTTSFCLYFVDTSEPDGRRHVRPATVIEPAEIDEIVPCAELRSCVVVGWFDCWQAFGVSSTAFPPDVPPPSLLPAAKPVDGSKVADDPFVQR